VQENAPAELAKRGYSPSTVEVARRFYNGQIAPDEMMPSVMKFTGAYYHHLSLLQLTHEMFMGLRVKSRPEALIFGHSQLLPGWNVMDRLREINVPTLVMAGRDDFLFPPEHQEELAARIPNARLEIIDRAGHNPQSERPREVNEMVRRFLSTTHALAIMQKGAR
jgi:proline iminopeptidase